MKYELILLDIWGNKRDGFEVNAAHRTGKLIEVPEELTDREIIRQLKARGYIRRNFRFSSFTIHGELGYTLFVYQAGRPVFTLDPVKG